MPRRRDKATRVVVQNKGSSSFSSVTCAVVVVVALFGLLFGIIGFWILGGQYFKNKYIPVDQVSNPSKFPYTMGFTCTDKGVSIKLTGATFYPDAGSALPDDAPYKYSADVVVEGADGETFSWRSGENAPTGAPNTHRFPLYLTGTTEVNLILTPSPEQVAEAFKKGAVLRETDCTITFTRIA